MSPLGPLAPWAEEPGRAAVLCDFDGTLSPIVDEAAEARPLPGAAELLHRLSGRLGLVAVVSGRPATFLRDRLAGVGPAVHLVGLYGMEWVADGAVHLAAEAEPWVPVVAEVVAGARAGAPPGVTVEDKGATVVLHWRSAPEAGDWCLDRAEAVAAETGLVVQPARMAVELRPPLATDKGSAVDALVPGHSMAAYAGDDAGDLAAFDALDRLEAAGGRAARVVVADRETPDELVRRADLVVEGPMAFLALLRELAGAVGA